MTVVSSDVTTASGSYKHYKQCLTYFVHEKTFHTRSIAISTWFLSAATHTLLDQCAFEQINICGMIQYDEDDADWVQTLSSTDVKDHTLAGNCRGNFS